MAGNFRIRTKEISAQSIALQLFGDFDASSAFELIYILDKSVKKSRILAINTDGLKTVYAFGINVFLPQMSKLNHTWANIQVTGRFSDVFREA